MNKILVVEDNPVIGMVIQTVLTDEGHQVEVRKSAMEGLYLMYTGFIPDLVLTDLIMREMDGRDFIQKMRNDKKLCSIPAVIITASIPNAENLPDKDQFQGLLSKPFDLEELVETVDKLVNHQTHIANNATLQASTSVAPAPVAV
ncbi:response regulator [Dehalobacter sp.]|uniref:response regulator n=1 Tax=Dehalobacter sp. TaxID=1962289 RepID=UPI002588224C|nr:response regulator [Dehalobacter sp.]MCG1024342.1 response regulator [Dehalobacter sp.]